jgi:hypothetical protein
MKWIPLIALLIVACAEARSKIWKRRFERELKTHAETAEWREKAQEKMLQSLANQLEPFGIRLEVDGKIIDTWPEKLEIK